MGRKRVSSQYYGGSADFVFGERIPSRHNARDRTVGTGQSGIDTLLFWDEGEVGGTNYNIVCGQMVLTGTVRSYSREVRAGVPALMQEVAENTAKAFGCTAKVEYTFKTPAVIHDDEQMNRIAKDAVLKLFGPEKLTVCRPVGGGDDFAYFMEKKPGIFAMIGAGNEALDCKWGHHHPKFKIDESVLYQGSAMFVQMTVDYLEETAK